MAPAMIEPTVSKEAGNPATPDDESIDRAINKLRPLWRRFHKKGLRVRYETGRNLNDLMGPPSKRQQYGKKAVAKVSQEIGVSRSEISRMRKFAEAIPDLDAFLSDRSKCTWTKVKAHLATIDEKGEPVKEAKTAGDAEWCRRSISNLTTKIPKVKINSTPEECQRVLAALEKLAEAVRNVFAVTKIEDPDLNSDSAINDEHELVLQTA